ncbi:hypothetical protein BUALT_Bualt03G0120600 [Buddleja alternifolia]|uniref:Uncharacterized protein n=1 Tax=Buddleja alternifolia TaxID=168488 RepID=A0AAV6Y0F1_9LAMI|nr:hypothetical protein BUALT_Bualt03G0120600 [Buddleja alternifolia]
MRYEKITSMRCRVKNNSLFSEKKNRQRLNLKRRGGTGDSIFLWKDPWHPLGVLEGTFPLGSRQLGLNAQFRLNAVIENGEWTAHGAYSSESAREFLRDKEEKKSCANEVAKQAIEIVKNRLVTLKLKDSIQSLVLRKVWKIAW